MKKVTRKSTTESIDDRDINAAVDRVYRKYGTDLHAFLRDIREELTLKRQEHIYKGLETSGASFDRSKREV
jgi:hypothetical protein